ncbi:MAG: FHA domain-containing protein [Candidatus Eremiobacteraeota bacterium]|nr:FHA domain-containing protein [Candidatus Eremiobacteraeota bacterium]
MTFSAHMRLGSVGALVAMAAFAVAAFRTRRPTAALGFSGASESEVKIELEVVERDGRRRVEGSCPFVVGRSSDADLLLWDPEVSRRHARFENDGSTVFVSDLHSSNGTFLNGRRVVDAIEVRPGDEIDVGTVRLMFLGSRPCN